MVKKLSGAVILTVFAHAAGAADLFNGRDFSGWELQTTPAAAIADVFRVLPDGVIASAGKPSGFLATQENYRNYKLHVEWRWTGKPGNGGVLLACCKIACRMYRLHRDASASNWKARPTNCATCS